MEKVKYVNSASEEGEVFAEPNEDKEEGEEGEPSNQIDPFQYFLKNQEMILKEMAKLR